MAKGVEHTVAALGRMTVAQLREKYLEVFGEPSRSGNRDFMFKRIALARAVAGGGNAVGTGEAAGGGTRPRRRPPHDPAPAAGAAPSPFGRGCRPECNAFVR
jgi:hypothetical protein